MASSKIVVCAFTAGELAPELRGRRDTNLYYMACETLRNCIVKPQGSALNRPGLRYASTIHVLASHPGVRLIDFVFNTAQTYVLCVYRNATKVYRSSDLALVATLSTPYQDTDLADIDFLQVADTVLITHPDYPMKQIQRSILDVWTVGNYSFDCPPQHKYWADIFTAIKITGALAAGTVVTLTAQDGAVNTIFSASQVGETWVLAGSRVTITTFTNTTHCTATIVDDIDNTLLYGAQIVGPAKWTQQAATADHGYFRAIAYHQDRLWLGGTRDAPYQLWGSRTAAPYDFQVFLDNITDADPIKVGVSTGRLDPIRYLVAGSGGLEVYTTGAEGYMPATVDQPLSPKTIAFIPQTQFGSRAVKPARLDAQTLFCQKDRGAIRQFIYSNVQQAYSAEPVTVRAKHLVDDPVTLTTVAGGFGQQADFLVVVNADGTGAIMTSEPTEQVRAWADLTSSRTLVDARAVANRVYVVTRGAGDAHYLEYFDEDAIYDSQVDATAGSPSTAWGPFTNLASLTADLWADGYWRGSIAVDGSGNIVTPEAFSSISIGLPISPAVRPMPPELAGTSLLGRCLRPVTADIMYRNSAGLRVAGQKVPDRPFDNATTTAPTASDAVVRVWLRGWSRDGSAAPTITREGPFPFEVLQLGVIYAVGGSS